MCFLGKYDLPTWLPDTCINDLIIIGSERPRNVDMQRLLRKRLTILCSPGDCRWELSDLLSLLQTTSIDFVQHDPSYPVRSDHPIELKGTGEKLKQLLKQWQVKFGIPVRLRVLKADNTTAVTELRSNGHAFFCMCHHCD